MEKNTRLILLFFALTGLAIWLVVQVENLKFQEKVWNQSPSVESVVLTTSNEVIENQIFSKENQIPKESNFYPSKDETPKSTLDQNFSWVDYGPKNNSSTKMTSHAITTEKEVAFNWIESGPQTPAKLRYDLISICDTLNPGDSIYSSLKNHGISDVAIYRLNEALKTVFEAQNARPKDTYKLLIDRDSNIISFKYTPRRYPEMTLAISRSGSKLTAQKLEKEIQTFPELIQVNIKNNLTNALKKVGESDALIDQLTDIIFGSVIDFSRTPREGDSVTILVEKKFLNKTFLRYGRILMANYAGKLIEQQAFYYNPSKALDGYFDKQGRSLARQFLLYPLPFSRISSHFNLRRFHPILKRKVPHLGTDYAAPIGTPVYATALGKITHAGRKGGYGLLVEIKHANGYRTRYAHLSKVLVKSGQQVTQQQIIGKVGTTGRSTGPHLHYEIIKNGKHLNPATINRGKRGKSLSKNHLPEFLKHVESLQNISQNKHKLSNQP